jgi:hypothetical protein
VIAMMASAKQQTTHFIIALCLFAAMCVAQTKLDQLGAAVPKHQRFMYLPDGKILKAATLGFREVASDFIWLQVIQVTGERQVSQEAGQWIARALDVVTTLDPKFVKAYEIGGIALCTVVAMPEESNRLLEKGMLHNPQAWTLPFLLGINHYFEFVDDEKAAEFMAKAARLPGAPPNVPRIAARLLVSARAPQQAVELLANVYEETTDENVRLLLEQRLKETIVERDLQILEQAIGRYQAEYARRPSRLEELVRPGLLPALPVEPFGGRYLYDAVSGKVRSSEVEERKQPRRWARSHLQSPK